MQSLPFDLKGLVDVYEFPLELEVLPHKIRPIRMDGDAIRPGQCTINFSEIC